MSTPNNNWEDHWRETLVDHEASPPSAMDWGGMEELLEAKVAPLSPIKAPITSPEGGTLTLPGLTWPVWVIAIASVLALGYWLGRHTALGVSQEMNTIPKKTSLADALTPPADTVFDTLFNVGANGELTEEIISIERAIVNRTTAQKSPEINTSLPAGKGPSPSTPVNLNREKLKAGSNDIAPSTPPAVLLSEAKAPTTSPEFFNGIRRPDTSSSAPGLSYDLSSESAARPNRGGYVRPLKALSPPTDRELWERRLDELLQSGKLVITPSRFSNGHFPAYRLRQ